MEKNLDKKIWMEKKLDKKNLDGKNWKKEIGWKNIG